MQKHKRVHAEITISSEEEDSSDVEIIQENIKVHPDRKSTKKKKRTSVRGTPYPQFKLFSDTEKSDFILSSNELLRPLSTSKELNEIHLMSSYDTSPSLIKEQLQRYPNVNIILLTTNPENFVVHNRVKLVKLKVEKKGWPDMYHSKYLIKLNNNNLEVYIGTGNFNEIEFAAVQNIWFYSGRLTKIKNNNVIENNNKFYKNLQRMFFLLNTRMDESGRKAVSQYVSKFKLFEFQNLKNYNIIIHHFDMILSEILYDVKTDVNIGVSDPLKLKIQCSSIGKWADLPYKILQFFNEVVFRSKCKTVYNIFFPTVSEIMSDPKSMFAAVYFHSPVLNKTVKSMFQGITNTIGTKLKFNTPAHSKSYILQQNEKVLWYYVTSANLSVTSWSNNTYYRKVKTHELGVCVLARSDLQINYVNIAEAIFHNKKFNEYNTVGDNGKIDVFGLINNKRNTKVDAAYENFNFNNHLNM